jgi:hypothetical protein
MFTIHNVSFFVCSPVFQAGELGFYLISFSVDVLFPRSDLHRHVSMSVARCPG